MNYVSPPPSGKGNFSLEKESALLNEQQRQAVLDVDGPCLISAAAGTGKTRVLTLRYARILEEGKAQAGQILAVTFTNRAAQEMKTRLGPILPEDSRWLWIGTFHSLSLRILRMHAELCKRTPSFAVLDTSDQLSVVRKILRAMNAEKGYTPQKILGKISQWKQELRSPSDLTPSPEVSFFEAYQAWLLDTNSFDFDDLLIECLRLFENHEEVCCKYRQQFRYILVDEYQDINHVQYMWLKMLAVGEDNTNICCVGDEDQSIYGWRGANIENIMRFAKDFPGAKIFHLEQNYRSTPHILSAASGLISHNRNRYGKILRTDRVTGERVKVQGVWDSVEEAAFVAGKISELIYEKKSLASVAILVRASFQTREFEELFMLQNIPYRVVGNTRFYERQEIKDFLAYIRAVYSPLDSIAFERVLGVPRRGIGETTLQEMHTRAREKGVGLEESARQMSAEDSLRSTARDGLIRLLELMDGWREAIGKVSLGELADRILRESGYEAMWKAEGDAQAETRIENVRALIQAMGHFKTLEEFIEHVSLLTETVGEASCESVAIMTLHAAKGLEFDTVFLPGWEENVFPHARCLAEGARGVEEERRLAYVGLTRARVKAIITFCWNRRMPQGWGPSAPSRFIEELPANDIELNLHTSRQTSLRFSRRARHDPVSASTGPLTVEPPANAPRTSFGRFPFSKRMDMGRSSSSSTSTPTSTSTSVSASASAVHENSDKRAARGAQEGAVVNHSLFGSGVVMRNLGNVLIIRFDTYGVKKVSAKFLRP